MPTELSFNTIAIIAVLAVCGMMGLGMYGYYIHSQSEPAEVQITEPTAIPTTVPTIAPTPVPAMTTTPITVLPTVNVTVNETTVVPTTTSALPVHAYGYTLRGKTGSVSLGLSTEVYRGLLLKNNPVACYRNVTDENTTCNVSENRQYYLNMLNESTEKPYLNTLVEQIQSKTADKDDQVRIAVSLVQRLNYDNDTYATIKADPYSRQRYPYEILSKHMGVCGDKSLLLAYLLRELGYGVVLFDFENESHMTVGIAAPVQYSYKGMGYAFIETTEPTIITDSEREYINVGKLNSTPVLYGISEGKIMESIGEEYADAQIFNTLIGLGNNNNHTLPKTQYTLWQSLVEKYGLKINGTAGYIAT